MAKRMKAISGSSSSETSVEVIGGNVDLLSNILLRVPPKSLLTFKSVSKYWLHLISDSLFASNHSRRNRICSISGLYFYYSYGEQPVNSLSLHSYQNPPPSLSFLDTVRQGFPIKIQNSCNGLLLCINDCTLGNRYNYKLSFIVCNPTTQKYTLLPHLPKCEFLAGFLAFDPSKSPHYKVVLYRPYDEFSIYSSETASWKLITVSEPLGIRVKGVFWNGAIHWLKDDNSEFHFRFDVDEEKLIKTPVPPKPKIVSINDISYYGECGGNLIVIQTRSRSDMRFKIIEMERDTFHWVVKYRSNLRQTFSLFPGIGFGTQGYKLHVICVVKEGDDFALVLAAAGRIVYYNLKSKTGKVLRDILPQGMGFPNLHMQMGGEVSLVHHQMPLE